MALTLAVAGCTPPPTLTPDVTVLAVAPTQCGADRSPKRIRNYIASEVEKEARRVRAAEFIVLGTVDRLVPEEHDGSIRTVVVMSVEECIDGSCGDSIRFFVEGGRLAERRVKTHPGVTYRVGERAVVLLSGSRARDDVPESRVGSKYIIDHDGSVVRKRIPVEQFVDELTAIVDR